MFVKETAPSDGHIQLAEAAKCSATYLMPYYQARTALPSNGQFLQVLFGQVQRHLSHALLSGKDSIDI